MTRIGTQQSEQRQAKNSFWICPAQVSGLWSWESTDQSLMYAIEPALLNQTAKAIYGLSAGGVELLSALHANDPGILAISYLFQEELDRPSASEPIYTDSLTQIFVTHLLRHYCTLSQKTSSTSTRTPDGTSDRRIQEVLDYIHSYLGQPLRLAELAAIANISQYHFARLFKQTLGVSPYQYIIRQRIEKAKTLLIEGKHSIAEVSSLVGFADQSRFAKHFKKYVGVTPTAFVRRI